MVLVVLHVDVVVDVVVVVVVVVLVVPTFAPEILKGSTVPERPARRTKPMPRRSSQLLQKYSSKPNAAISRESATNRFRQS